MPSRSVVAVAMEGLAGTAVLAGDGERAALLLGAAVAARGGAVDGDPDVVQVAAAARRLIGTGTYATAYRRGTEMSSEEALALAGE